MIISLDVITRKKLVLVKQMYQRALVQSLNQLNPVSRIFAVIGFDLANETALKTVVSALNPTKNLANDFQGVLSQAENELGTTGLTIPDKVKIQHVRTLRNDAQHKAKYPNEVDVNDCRTYTRDFLVQTFSDVWGENFESFNLIEAIQNVEAKKCLRDAEDEFTNLNFAMAVANAIVAFETMIGKIAAAFTESIDRRVEAIIVEENFKKNSVANQNVLKALKRTQELVAYQVAGINSQNYLRYLRYTKFIHVARFGGGNFSSTRNGPEPSKDEAEFVLNFVTDSIIQIENLDNEVLDPYHRLRFEI